MTISLARPGAFLWPSICPACCRSIPLGRQTFATALTTTRRKTLQAPGGSQAFRSGPARAFSTTHCASAGLKGLRNRTRQNVDDGSGNRPRTILGQPADVPIRARFAPSPTGYLHLGSLRTALFNNVTARATKGGAFILRIEDTDQNRLVADAEERLLQDLKWAGLSWDEGPDNGGPHGPYRQSERLGIYTEHARKLLDDGHAYRCFCTPEQLDAEKRRLHEAGEPTVYPGTCRAVSSEESARRAGAGEPHVVRFRAGKFGRPKLRDAIYGPFQKKDVDEDFVLVKTDGFPTYHFANVVDDHLMKITHVIRGEEWLISTPKHVALYEAFGWQPPTFAHLGLLVNPDRTKLSKRNDSTNLSTYQQDGVFPMALLAWLANLGSSFRGDAKPPRDIEGVADALTFKFTRGGIKLNFEKLQYFQGRYRDAVLWDPRTDLAEHENRLIDQNLVQPLLNDIDAITNGSPRPDSAPLPPPEWMQQSPLDLTPALRNEPSRPQFIRKVFGSKPGDFPAPESLISQHAYLFWRVPPHIYRASLSTPLDQDDMAVLDALNQVVEQPDLWEAGSADGSSVMKAVRVEISSAEQGKPVPVPTVHNVLRLVAAGRRDVVSMNSARLFILLGQDEWRHRLNALKEAMNEKGA